jgi:adenosylcobinamide-GDP ribazoletransferase
LITDRFLSTFSLITRIPVKVKFNFDPSRIDFYLPVTGIISALFVFIAYFIFSFAGNMPLNHPWISAILIIIIQYLCFNLFHLDGLMDTADAFLGTVNREKRLEILKDSRVGVYGFFAGFMDLMLKIVLLSTLLPLMREYAAIIPACAIAGRYSAALIPSMAPPAGKGGLGALAKDSKALRTITGAVIAFFVWALAAWGLVKLAALIPGSMYASIDLGMNFLSRHILPGGILALLSLVVIGPLTALFYAQLYRQGIGGYTGDAMGAAVETGEMLYLAAAFIVVLFR